MIDAVSKKGHHVKTFVTTAAKRSANQSTHCTIWWERGLRHVETVQWSTNALWSWQQELQQHVVSTSLTSWKQEYNISSCDFTFLHHSWRCHVFQVPGTHHLMMQSEIWTMLPWSQLQLHWVQRCSQQISAQSLFGHGCQLLQVALTKVSMLALFQSLSADQVQISALFFLRFNPIYIWLYDYIIHDISFCLQLSLLSASVPSTFRLRCAPVSAEQALILVTNCLRASYQT